MGQTETQNQGLCSIEVCKDGIAVVFTPEKEKPEIMLCDFREYEDKGGFNNAQIRKTLKQVLQEYNLKKISCNWVLHPDFYRLTLIDKPNVAQAEYKKAVHWQIKDLISYPLEDLATVVFYPDEPERSLEKIYVIAAQNSFLQGIIDVIQDVELYPEAVDTPEFVSRNLIAGLAKAGETVGFLDVVDDSSLLVLVKEGNVKFVRRIPVGLKSMKDGSYGLLVTELQRSFNYSKAGLKQDEPTRLFMPPKIDFDPNIKQHIEADTSKEVSFLELKDIVPFKIEVTRDIEAKCWAAIGGILRNVKTDEEG